MISQKENFDITLKKIINKFETKIEKLDLKVQIGTEDASITAYLVAGLAMFISILLKENIDNYKEKRYIVLPLYVDSNILKININAIFKIELIKYMYDKVLEAGKET